MSVFTCHQADAVLDDAALQTVAGGFDWPLDINPAYFGPGPAISAGPADPVVGVPPSIPQVIVNWTSEPASGGGSGLSVLGGA